MSIEEKARLFDYMCWLEEKQQTEHVIGVQFLFLSADWHTCWGDTYAEAVQHAFAVDKEDFDKR
jgi:hypothetical protein